MNERRGLQPVEEETDEGIVTDEDGPTAKNRTQKKVTEYYEDRVEDPYRRNDLGKEQITMSESSTDESYEDSPSYGTASTEMTRVRRNKKSTRVGNLRTGSGKIGKIEYGSQQEEKEDPTKEATETYKVRHIE